MGSQALSRKTYLTSKGRGKMPELPPVAGTLEEHAADVEAFASGTPLERLGRLDGGLGHTKHNLSPKPKTLNPKP